MESLPNGCEISFPKWSIDGRGLCLKTLGYEKEGQEHKVCILKKALYGLKKIARAWYSRIDAYLLENGFEKCEGEPTLYIKEKDGKMLIVVLYVDDVIFTGNDAYLIENSKTVMKE